MSAPSHDVLIIGGGHNGLVAAAVLAKAGRKVTVLERRGEVGGLAEATDFHPGYRSTGILHDTCRTRPQVVSELGLSAHGIRLVPPPPVFVPQREGPGVLLHRDPDRADDELARHGHGSAQAYRAYRAYIDKVRPLILSVMDAAPPDAAPSEASIWPPAKIVPLLKSAVGILRLGQKDMMELLHVGPSSAEDWMSEYFESRLLRATLTAPGLAGTYMAPRSPQSAGMALIAEAMSGDEIPGGPARLVNALVEACKSRGVTIQTGSAVARIRVAGDRAVGVELEGGRALDAGAVLSTVGPKTTLLDLLDPMDLPSYLEGDVRNVRVRGTVSKIHIALRGQLSFACRPGEIFERISIGEDPVELERAFDEVRFRRLPGPTVPLDVRVPSISDPTLAPEGHHVVSILVHATPYDLEGGWTDAAKSDLLDRVMHSLSRYAPNVRDLTIGHEVLSPADLETRYGLAGGHIHHGELALDQFWAMRPIPSLSRYKTPIQGLFLGSPGLHPGGGITGGPGLLAAQAMLGR